VTSYVEVQGSQRDKTWYLEQLIKLVSAQPLPGSYSALIDLARLFNRYWSGNV